MTEYSEEITRVYWEMMGKTEFKHIRDCPEIIKDFACQKCRKPFGYGVNTCEFANTPCPIPDPVDLSPPELAFFMRDKCDKDHWAGELWKILGKPVDFSEMAYGTSEDWIRAACAAWSWG